MEEEEKKENAEETSQLDKKVCLNKHITILQKY